jgi:hypothetical protein
MIEGEDESRVVPIGVPVGAAARLPYTIELWTMARTGPERIIGRAASVVLARAIFTAAQNEHLGRLIRLRRGAHVLAEAG